MSICNPSLNNLDFIITRNLPRGSLFYSVRHRDKHNLQTNFVHTVTQIHQNTLILFLAFILFAKTKKKHYILMREVSLAIKDYMTLYVTIKHLNTLKCLLNFLKISKPTSITVFVNFLYYQQTQTETIPIFKFVIWTFCTKTR